MGAAANTTNVPQILKQIWKDEIYDFQYVDRPFYAMVDKDTSWDGIQQNVTVQYGGMGGRSSKFDKAKQNKGPAKYKQMQVQTSDNFAVWSVDHKLITLSRNQRGALVRALNECTEKAMTKFKASMCWMLWRNGGGACAQILSIVGSVITLVDPNDVRNFDLDDQLEFSTDDGTGAAGVLSGTLQVTAIDEDAGTLTTLQAPSTISGLAANCFIFHEGDYAAAFYGVPAYVTPFAPGTNGVPASIWGMTRTDFPTRLSGHRFTASGLIVIEAIKNALMKAYRRSCDVTHLFVPPEVFNDVELALGTQKVYADEKVGNVGFQGIQFPSQGGRTIKLFPDADIPKDKNGNKLCFGLNLDCWKLHSAEELPMWLTAAAQGDKKFMVEENANASEGRLGGYGQLYPDAPGNNFVLTLS